MTDLWALFRGHCFTFAIDISETVRDSNLVPKDHRKEMAYGTSSHVTDNVTWPWKVKLMTMIRLEPNILKTAGDTI